MVTGTAGSGKSTTVLRLATELHASGVDVRWLDSHTEMGIAAIHKHVTAEAPTVLVIDDVDEFNAASGPLMVELVRKNPGLSVIASARSTCAERFSLIRKPSEVDHRLIVVPPLGDSDIDDLLDALDRAGVLGRLKGKPHAEQRKAMAHRAGRQLLVGMIEATSGQRFDDKIDDECQQLEKGQATIYATVSIATRMRHWLAKDEILSAVGGKPVETLAELDACLFGNT